MCIDVYVYWEAKCTQVRKLAATEGHGDEATCTYVRRVLEATCTHANSLLLNGTAMKLKP